MTLYELLMEYRREDLLEITRVKGLRGVSRLRKSEVAERLSAYMLSPSVMITYFQWLRDDEIEMLEQTGEAPELLLQSEYAERIWEDVADDTADGEDSFQLLPEVMDVYRQMDTSVFHRKRRRCSFILSCLWVLDSWYGTAPVEVMVRLSGRAPELGITEAVFLEALGELPGELRHYQLLGGSLWHRDVMDYFEAFLEEQGDAPFYIPTREEIETLGRLGWLPETAGAKELQEMLEEHVSGKDFAGENAGEDAETLVRLLWKFMSAGYEIREVMEYLERWMEGMTDAEKIMLVEPVCQMYENVRLLSLRGHTRKEIACGAGMC